MKKWIAILLTLALCLSMAACTAPKQKDHREEPEENNRVQEEVSQPEDDTEPVEVEPQGSTPLLYKVTGENGAVVWLFGSIHVGIDEMYPLPDYVMDAYMEADSLAVECDVLAAQENPSSLMSALQNMIYTDGTTIADHIPQELYDDAVAILKENNTYNGMLDYYKPVLWFSFVEAFSYANYGFDEEKGIDLFLLNLAKDEGKEILEVESVDFQYNMLASFSPELQVLLLEDAVENYGSPEVKTQLEQMLKLWCQGDEAALAALLAEESTEPLSDEELALLEEYNTAMIVDRNISMTDYAENVLQNGGKVFICVGAAHIVGEGAMVDLLRQRGYTVELVR